MELCFHTGVAIARSIFGRVKMSMQTIKPLFSLGQVVATRGFLDADVAIEAPLLLGRHALGDWGMVSNDDKKVNDQAVIDGDRVLSAYQLQNGTKIWIITEWDRSVTTLLLPEEY
jgi:hypothetical protein